MHIWYKEKNYVKFKLVCAVEMSLCLNRKRGTPRCTGHVGQHIMINLELMLMKNFFQLSPVGYRHCNVSKCITVA